MEMEMGTGTTQTAKETAVATAMATLRTRDGIDMLHQYGALRQA